MKLNKHHQMILNEQDIVESWLSGNKIESATLENNSIINTYNNWCDIFESDHKIKPIQEFKDGTYIDHWFMPDKYKNIDLEQYLFSKVSEKLQHNSVDFVYNSSTWIRVEYELKEFELRGLFPLLKFLIYLVDVCKENNIVMGVGRGSSVASYVLYLIGVHKIDSIKYELDIKEFLK